MLRVPIDLLMDHEIGKAVWNTATHWTINVILAVAARFPELIHQLYERMLYDYMSLDIFHQWICLWDLQILLYWKILFRVPLTVKYRNSMEFISLQMRLIQLEFGSESSFSPIWIYIFTNHKSSKWLISAWPKTMVLYLFWNPHSEIQNISKGLVFERWWDFQ